MGRLTAVFVATCMVLIACSIGAVLYLRFGLSGADSAIVALTALTALALYNAVSTRLYNRGDFGGQVGELSRGTADLARQVAEVNRRVAAIEGNAHAAVERTLAATHPITAEMGEVGGLIRQIAETVAAASATSVPTVKPMPPIAPAVAAPPAETGAPRSFESRFPESSPAEPGSA